MNRINYQKKMEEVISLQCRDRVPRLLLHSCCGPCSTYCIQVLAEHFAVTVFYYNPNIYPDEEYHMRAAEQRRFIDSFPTRYPVDFIEGEYDTTRFYDTVRGYEKLPEGQERCFLCYRLRLEETAKLASYGKYDFFTTTLTISPLKNADKLNEIGLMLAESYGIFYLPSDFKKKDGYKQSTRISAEYQMYRQYYCGCVFSKEQRDREIREKQAAQTANIESEE